ncbi:GDSL esterase/lipase At1g09390-like isoform X2 [Asparagus officinalis]|uniref:GDSL esterase/lipase At1g09390-like isoform X2 n=1 Tax=Asparagus officinalis TaxID=4686 RepID=UPI00098E61A1|nr:GDSL esterase/lipase At1g09390-like isoform X2 [Asparagus officinalis]
MLVSVLLLALAVFVVSECGTKAIIFNFGDSNSDTGGYSAGLGFNTPLPIGRLFPHQPSGRLCDGRLVIDFLCEYLNISYLSPYLESLGSDFKHGANFAISGAATQAYATNPFSLPVQVLQFLRFKSRSLHLLAQGSKDLINEDGFMNALYTIDIGQNDLYGAFASNFSDRINITVNEIKNAIQTIYDHGGKNFWVHNTGPFGCLPERVSLMKKNNSDLDAYGCLITLNNGAKELNFKLSAVCDELNSELENATVVYTDIYSVKYDLIANSSNYGFESPLMACCGFGGPPYNFNMSIRCGSTRSQACSINSKYISWDGVHYTEAANAMVASKILSTEYSKPRIKFDYFCSA